MFKIRIKKHFDAAHHLLNYEGLCSQVHGHRFDVIIEYRFLNNDNNGMCVDFKELKKDIEQVLLRYDHNDLNVFIEQPTAEWISKLLYQELQNLNINAYSVRVFESPDCEVEYVE